MRCKRRLTRSVVVELSFRVMELDTDRETLVSWSAAIAAFLREYLHLALRPDMTTPFPVRRGIDFVGWKTWWNRRLPRRRTLGDMRARLQTFERAAVRSVWDGAARRSMPGRWCGNAIPG